MLHVFTYKYKEILYTCHPLIQVEFVINVEAQIDDESPDEINILRCLGLAVLGDMAETHWASMKMPDESTREGAMFWALLREAGRNHFHNLQKSLKV